MQTLFGERLRQHVRSIGPAPAIVSPGLALSYSELLGRVQRFARWLAGAGCRPGEVVGVAVADEITHLVASLALLDLGIPQVALRSRDPAAMNLQLAQRLAVGRIVTTDRRHSLPDVELLLPTPEVLADGFVDATAADADPDAPAIYFTSSGTTGRPKLFALSQRALAWRAERIAESEGIGPAAMGPQTRVLTPVSVEEAPAKSKRLYSLYLGMTSVFLGGDTAESSSLPEFCGNFGVTLLEMGVLHASSVVSGRDSHRRFPGRTTVYATGSRVPAALRRAFRQRFGTPLFVHYGAREFGRIATTFPDGHDDALEAVGRPVPWIDLEIVDDAGRTVPAGEIGAVRVRSECMTQAYHRDSEATARHFRDGWFYPGDLGSLTSDGALRIHGRADDVMNLNSIKIAPAEIERALEDHPAVKAAAAFAKASTAHGDIPVAAVELHDSATIGVDELMAHAKARLGVRAPRKIFVLDALPRSAAGKIVKSRLADLIVPGS